ncbi:MAG: hypothetical protein ABEK50_01135 [bacterium]
MTESEQSLGLVLKGYSELKSLHFLLSVIIANGQTKPRIDSFTAAGAPENSYFTPVSTMSDPEDIQGRILDVRRKMSQESKNFYNEEVEEQFKQFFLSNLKSLTDMIQEHRLTDLETFIRDNFYEFEINEINAASVPPDKLQFEPSTNQSSSTRSETSDNRSEPSETASDDSVTTIEVNPEIDVKNGQKVEKIPRGTSVIVRLTDRSAKLFGSELGPNQRRLPADFLEFTQEDGSPEGRIRVRLQEGLHGVGEVSRGSLIRLHEPALESKSGDYERQLQPLVVIIVSLMLILVVFAYLVIF